MATQQRPGNRRGASGAWSRLKAPPTDPLQAYGLPSKGETRLNDPKAQENFYNKIVERYMKFCGSSGGGIELESQFAALTIQTPLIPDSLNSSTTTQARNSNEADTALPLHPSNRKGPTTPSTELQLIIASMRKLREAIVATRRHDTFAQRAYIFLIRACILTQHWESYQPALLYLLHDIHPHTPLPPHEVNECAIYQILDLACRQSDLHAAYAVKLLYNIRDRRLEMILKALVGDNWAVFWKVRKRVDGYQRAILGFAEEGVRLHVLKCLGRSYFTADRVFVERVVERGWKELVEGGVGWELSDGGKSVVIRRAKGK